MKKDNTVSIGMICIWGLALLGAALMARRFIYGMGSVTNLSDGYPWGLWVGVDILAGIAIASGGFVMTGTIHLFGGHKFHSLSRPAILVAFLGYLCYMLGTILDIGRYWNVPKIFIFQNNHSPLFEVAMCVFMYSTVLALEFLPVVFEKFKMKEARQVWYSLSPFLIIIMMATFCWWLTRSRLWMAAVVLILLFWEFFMRKGLMPRDKQVPILMVIAGVTFSTMHQSTLGGLYLIAAEQLHPLWRTSLMPALFLISAIAAAPAIVSFVALSVEKLMGIKTKFSLIADLSKAMPFLLGLYLIVKILDLAFRGIFHQIFSGDIQSMSWWGEIVVGILAPFAIYVFAKPSPGGLRLASLLVVAGLVWNRCNVAMIGLTRPGWDTYYPHWAEVFITIGIYSMGILAFRYIVKNFPVYSQNS